MDIYLTVPRGATLGGCREEIADRWQYLAQQFGVPRLHVIEPHEHEIHGELLTRLWISDLYDRLLDGSDILISEMDFVPDPRVILDMSAASGFVFAAFLDRVYQPDADVNLKPGKLKTLRVGEIPLIGAWFIRLPAGDWVRDIPRDWLAAGGPHNDAANLALVHLLEAKVLNKDRPVRFLQHRDLWPLVHGIEYPGIGAHLFFARDLDAPDDQPIGWTHTAKPLTAKRHRQGVRNYLWTTSELSKLTRREQKAIARAAGGTDND